MEVKAELTEELTVTRRKFHSLPEMSRFETKTAEMVIQELQILKPTKIITGIGGTGLVAIFDSGIEGPKILFRSEMDALSIEEVNTFDHKSVNVGCSHKCGHDGHMATLLGLARLVSLTKPKRGMVMCLFQPAEETGTGAQAMLADPAFAEIKPDLVFAYHNVPGYPLGQVILREGAMTASVRSLVIKLHGRTSHAAEPECGLSPALTIATLINEFTALSNNALDRPDFCVITPVHINMGEVAYGVAAGYGEVHLTIRTWTEREMEKLVSRMTEVVTRSTEEHKLTFTIESLESFMSNENSPEGVELLKDAVEISKVHAVFHKHPMKWGEDFGYFTAAFKGAFFCVGAGEDAAALHSPDYDFNDGVIEVGLRMFSGILCSPKLDMY